MNNNPLNTVCDLAWNYPIFNMERGEFRSCCRTPSNKITEEDLQKYGTDAFLNNPKLKQIRLDLVNGVRHDDCKTCWHLEDNGMKSPRQGGKQFWDHLRIRKQAPDVDYTEGMLLDRVSKITDINDPALNSNYPYMLEISMGNTCDMKCMYCNHHYSTQWATEEIKLGRITQEQYDREFPKATDSFDEKFWEWLDKTGIEYCSRIGIIGGEPLITPKFYELVEKLIESKKRSTRKRDTMLWIVTNMNTPPNYLEKFLKYLPTLTEHFTVEVLVSMESVGTRAEYIRNGLSWDRFTSNIDKLLSNKDLKFNFGFIPSLNSLSISTLKEFVQFAENLYRTHGRPVAIKQNIVNLPSQHSPFILTPDFAKYVDDCVEYMKTKTDMPTVPDAMGTWDAFIVFAQNLADSIRNNTMDSTAQRKYFAEWADDFEMRRKLNVVQVFPEYADFYNMCKGL
jgi:sulfatase maturation enzyme AslB (radical SAM superfamily)